MAAVVLANGAAVRLCRWDADAKVRLAPTGVSCAALFGMRGGYLHDLLLVPIVRWSNNSKRSLSNNMVGRSLSSGNACVDEGVAFYASAANALEGLFVRASC
jgi:hypothetical protein